MAATRCRNGCFARNCKNELCGLALSGGIVEGIGMPLSDNEQKILAEIEKHLHESDPRLAKEVSETTLYRHALGSLKWSIAGCIGGLVIMVATLQIHFLVAFFGFMLMLASAMGFERNFRNLGRASMNSMSEAIKAAATKRSSEDELGEETTS